MSLSRNANNLVTFFSFAVWILVPIFSWRVIGVRGGSDFVEYCICFVVFMGLMNSLRLWLICFGSCTPKSQEFSLRFGYHFFLKADIDIAAGLVVLLLNVVVTLILILVECACCSPRGLHTWWLLNSSISYAAAQKKAFEPGRTRPLPNFRPVSASWISAAGSGVRSLFSRRQNSSERQVSVSLERSSGSY